MREICADSTVLIFLGKLRRLSWLRHHYDLVLIPPIVYDEVVVRGKSSGEPDASLVNAAVETGWVEVREPASTDGVAHFDLEVGETDVLALALEQDHERILADEEAVREVARLLGLRPRGTLSVMFDGLDRGAIDFDGFLEHLERLVGVGFYLDEAVYLEAVRQARRIADE